MKDDEIEGTQEYLLLARFMREQTVTEEDVVRLKTKEDGGMDSSILQNPADPDATYRLKAGKEHQGYVANIEESVGENGSIITDYQFEQNNYSDSQFFKDSMERRPEDAKPITVLADGAYGGEENQKLASEKNVTLITTGLSGRQTRAILADFEFDDAGEKVVACPAGHEPRSCSNPQKNGRINLSFDRDLCANCPHKDECGAKIHKRVSNVSISHRGYERALQLRKRGTEEFKNYAHLRNGVETVPSILRNNHRADRMPVRGLRKSRAVFGFKVAAANIAKLVRFEKAKLKGKNPRGEVCPEPGFGRMLKKKERKWSA